MLSEIASFKSGVMREKDVVLQNKTSGDVFGLKRHVKKRVYVVLQNKTSGRDLSMNFGDTWFLQNKTLWRLGV